MRSLRLLITRQPGESLETFGRRVAHLNRTYTLGADKRDDLRDAWGGWLGAYPWDLWGTLTFADGNFTHEAASRAWRYFEHHVANEHPLASWFVGHEVGAQGRTHLHCLLGSLMLGEQRETATTLWDWWFKRYGRCELRGYDPERGASHYVSKYITKELAHYDLDLRGFTCLSDTQHQPPPDTPSWKRRRGPAV